MRRRQLIDYIEILDDLVVATQGDASVDIEMAASDSRRVRPGGLFCAIRGSRADGEAYIGDAVARGARAVVSESGTGAPASVAHIRVKDAYAAAGRLAACAWGFPARSLSLYGVTGTNGKTTTSYLLRDLLRGDGRTVGMLGTVVYDDGVSETPADRTTPTPFELQERLHGMVQAGCTDAVMEVSSHALAQRRLGAAPVHGAIFTNLSGDHLDYHQTMDAYFDVKARLFRENLLPGGPAVVNADDPYGRELLSRLPEAARGVSVGLGPQAACAIRGLTMDVRGLRMILETPAGPLGLRSPLIGAFNAMNIAEAVLLALAVGVPAPRVQQTVPAAPGAPGRLQALHAPSGYSVYVDYAHTDDALLNVMRALRQLNPGRLVVVFGCGGDRDRTKRSRMGRAAATCADRVVVTSDNPRSEDPEAIIAEILAGTGGADVPVVTQSDRRQAIRHAVSEARAGDVILVAGKGHETYQEIAGERLPFDDDAEVREAIAQSA